MIVCIVGARDKYTSKYTANYSQMKYKRKIVYTNITNKRAYIIHSNIHILAKTRQIKENKKFRAKDKRAKAFLMEIHI